MPKRRESQPNLPASLFDLPDESKKRKRKQDSSDDEEPNLEGISRDLAQARFEKLRERFKRYSERSENLHTQLAEIQADLADTHTKMQSCNDKIATYLKILAKPAPMPTAIAPSIPIGMRLLESPEPSQVPQIARQEQPREQPRQREERPEPRQREERPEPVAIVPSIKVGQAERAAERIGQTGTKKFERAFNRKPRLLFKCPYDPHVLVTSALDSNISFYSSDPTSRGFLSMAQGRDLTLTTFIEEAAWIRKDLLGLVPNAFVVRDGNKVFSPYQLALLSTPKFDRHDLAACPVFQLQTFTETPHEREKGPSCLTSNGRDKIFTGGLDKTIQMWNVPLATKPTKQEPISTVQGSPKLVHQLHTSAIHSLYFDDYRHQVVSGGSDTRLILYDVQASKAELVEKTSLKINTVLKNPVDANLVIVQGYTEDKHLAIQVFDRRARKIAATYFAKENLDTAKTSRYVSADISHNGLYIAQGMECPPYDIALYDVRMAKPDPVSRISGQHDSRVVRTCFYGPNSSGLASIGVDHNLLLHDLQYTSC